MDNEPIENFSKLKLYTVDFENPYDFSVNNTAFVTAYSIEQVVENFKNGFKRGIIESRSPDVNIIKIELLSNGNVVV